ncbi:Uu.00g049630.m01.CDS01 [Anthostomella pinea]|uniref:Uu.00g049630.m01.CDS01 n=1 Tax=Anthostomella pinea TaxID=933095 RepID=A0AAI8YET1_9PEZI|nr:Uu.00g049630.m01.CDS01 [Anthostomella pinea]
MDGIRQPAIILTIGVSEIYENDLENDLFNELRGDLDSARFSFYEVSNVIAEVVPGGLKVFPLLSERMKAHWRKMAIRKIHAECLAAERTAIVAGYSKLWPGQSKLISLTQDETAMYTHVLYLNVSAPDFSCYHRKDTEIKERQYRQRGALRKACYENGILFWSVSPESVFSGKIGKVPKVILDFHQHIHGPKSSRAWERKLEDIVNAGSVQKDTYLVVDTDKTLTGTSTCLMLDPWMSKEPWGTSPLETLFSGPLGYIDAAFRQAALFYEEVVGFNDLCDDFKIIVQPDFISFLRRMAKEGDVGIVFCDSSATALPSKIVSSPSEKPQIVERLRKFHRMYVWALGDTAFDLPMLKQADRAIVMVGEEKERCKLTDQRLPWAIEGEGLEACQILLPKTVTPWLDTTKLPIVDIDDPKLIARNKHAVKLLAGFGLTGSAQYEAYRRIGWYLATEYLAAIIGTDYVEGTKEYRFPHEEETWVVAVVSWAEVLAKNMAKGVLQAMPRATLVRASTTHSIAENNSSTNRRTIVFVDAHMNSGVTIEMHVLSARARYPHARIVIVAGVVRAPALSRFRGLGDKYEETSTLVFGSPTPGGMIGPWGHLLITARGGGGGDEI